MKKEQVVLSFIAILLGLLVAGIAFYFYQSTKVIPPSKTKTITITPPIEKNKTSSSIYLSLDSPKDEEVVDSKTVTVSGKTTPDATVLITTNASDQVITPAKNGSFSTTVTIENMENQILVKAISPNGEEIDAIRVVTFSTESF